MIGCRLRVTTLLLLLATIICSFSVGSVEAQQNQETDLQHGATTTSFAPNGPARNTGTGSVDETNASTHAATGPGLKGTNSSHEAAGSGHEAAGSGHEAAGSGHEAKPADEAPTFMMFLGPAIAGVLAIVLIGCVIAFKNRKGK